MRRFEEPKREGQQVVGDDCKFQKTELEHSRRRGCWLGHYVRGPQGISSNARTGWRAPSLHLALLREIARCNRLDELSMGMSADFDVAVRFGATHVRVGTAIFGARRGE
jgi:hypothetical protein